MIGISKLALKLREDGGFTYNEHSGALVTEGFAFSEVKGAERIYDHEVTPAAIMAFIIANDKALRSPENNVGGWVDTQTGLVYLDVSTVISDRTTAEERARSANQLAIYDLSTGTEIRL